MGWGVIAIDGDGSVHITCGDVSGSGGGGMGGIMVRNQSAFPVKSR